MALSGGEYEVKTTKVVIVWPKADKNGDMAGTSGEVWETDPVDGSQTRVKDKEGNDIFLYEAPEGFRNFPSFTHEDNYCLTDERGRLKRTPTGEAISIKPGQALVLNPDGTVEVLADERAQRVFADAHASVGGTE